MNTHIDTARTLPDNELLARVKSLATHERGATAELIAHLTEVETRDLHLASGYGSMFTYCRGALLLSEYEAYHRIAAARVACRFPVVLDRLAEGAVNLTTVRLLSRHLTDDNHVEVLESARGRSKAEVKRIVARLAPQPDVPTTVQKLPAPRSTPESSPAAVEPSAVGLLAASTTAPASAVVPPTPTRAEVHPAVVDALSPDRYKLQLTITGDTLEKLELAKDMLRHAIPSGDVAQILDRALALLVDDLARKKFAASDRPRRSDGVAPDSHDVSAEVKRVVFVRDRGRCAFVGRDGHRCHERAYLEFHHVKPFSEGGLPTVENIQLRCRAHNNYEWRLRSSDVRRREEEWLCLQVKAGGAPWSAAGTGSGPSRPSRRGREADSSVRRSPRGGLTSNRAERQRGSRYM
jgi:hypothetical protein